MRFYSRPVTQWPHHITHNRSWSSFTVTHRNNTSSRCLMEPSSSSSYSSNRMLDNDLWNGLMFILNTWRFSFGLNHVKKKRLTYFQFFTKNFIIARISSVVLPENKLSMIYFLALRILPNKKKLSNLKFSY